MDESQIKQLRHTYVGHGGEENLIKLLVYLKMLSLSEITKCILIFR
jgi:hypothetical protein